VLRRLIVAAGCAAAATFVLAGRLGAQTGVLSGIIYDQSNKAGLVGVEVRIKGTDLVATTRTDGRFTIANVPVGSHELEATREGFRPFRLPLVKVASADTARVQLAMSMAERTPLDLGTHSDEDLEEIARKIDLVTAKFVAMRERPDEQSEAGVSAVTKFTSLGEVSKNAPLYIIDGILLSPGTIPRDFEGLNIKNIEVIKGAAAESLYGSRAANGVIKITTKPNPD
jgi:TonB-dependent SusC/RagA subfamily outer membrane receptor